MATNKNRPYQDEQKMRRLYVEEGLSSREIASRFGCAKNTVLDWLDRHGIDKETPKYQRPPTFYTESDGREAWHCQIDYQQYMVLHHRLLCVAEYGLEEVTDSVVHHKNGIPWDNRPNNLEVLSQTEHVDKHTRQGDMSEKLSPEQVREIREMGDKGLNPYEIARKHEADITAKTAQDVVERETWTWLE